MIRTRSQEGWAVLRLQTELRILTQWQSKLVFQFEQLEEPTPRYAAQYPFNHVKSTESGHVEEFDDTPGSEEFTGIIDRDRSKSLDQMEKEF